MLELNKIYCGDCLDLMREMPDKCIDLTITSPPYDNLREYKGYSFRFEEIAKELFRITKDGGVVVWVVGDATVNGSETGTSFKQALYFKECGFNLHDTMIWNKKSFRYPETTRYYPCFEYMFILSKGKPKTVNLINDRKNVYSGDKVAREHQVRNPDSNIGENSAFRNEPGRRINPTGVRGNIWEINVSACEDDKLALLHPATFPKKLATDHILSWSNEGDLILDPFSGSGTTCKMAKMNLRNFIGIDISQEYCDIAEKRLEKVNNHRITDFFGVDKE